MFTQFIIITVSDAIVTLAGSDSTTFADGTGGSATFNYPAGVAVSPDGLMVFVGDMTNHRIRSVTSELLLLTIITTVISCCFYV